MANPPSPRRTDRRMRRAWSVAALGYLVSCGMPWSSCENTSPVGAVGRWAGSALMAQRVWALAIALPMFVMAVTATLQSRGPMSPGVARPVAVGTALIVGLAAALHAFAAQPVSMQYQGVARVLVRALFVLPPLAALAVLVMPSSARRADLIARWLASMSALMLPVAWAGALDRAGATIGTICAVAALLTAGRVVEVPVSSDDANDTGARMRRLVTAASLAWLAFVLFALYRGQTRPRFIWPLPPW